MPFDVEQKELLDCFYEGVAIVDSNCNYTFWSKGAERFFGFTPEEMQGKPCCEFVTLEGKALCKERCPFLQGGDANVFTIEEANVWFRHKHGHKVPVAVKIVPICANGKVEKVMEVFVGDAATHSGGLIDSLAKAALVDPLTQIHNRRFLEAFIFQQIQRHARFKSLFAVAFVDLDNFRRINNTFGHDMGDKMLLAVTHSLKGMLRQSDALGRWGGEEFLVVFEISQKDAAVKLGEKIRALIADIEIKSEFGEILRMTASVGVAIAQAGDTVETLVKRADALMYHSKKNGKNMVSYDF